jgi:uncharacterized membrane protein YoaK (UPF0700 family)
LFTAHVTGNFVLIGSELARSSSNVLLKLLVFPAFIVAVAFARILVLWLERRRRAALQTLLLLQLVLLAGFMLLGWAASLRLQAQPATAFLRSAVCMVVPSFSAELSVRAIDLMAFTASSLAHPCFVACASMQP